MDTLEQKILKPRIDNYIELIILDCTNIPSLNTIYYLVADITNSGNKVMFGLQAYDPFPLVIDGIDQTTEGAPPRPKITLANVSKLFGTLAFSFEDLVGCKVTYIRTFKEYLDLASNISAPPLSFTIGRKVNHISAFISWELRSLVDRERKFLPGRQMLKRDFPGLGINKQIR